MERRMIIAILLSLGIWIFWLNYIKKPLPPASDNIGITEERQGDKGQDPGITKQQARRARPEVKERVKVYSSGTRTEESIEVVTKIYTAHLSNRGGIVNGLVYNNRNTELALGNILNVKGYFDFPLHFSEDEFLRGNALEDSIWDYSQDDKNIKFYNTLSLNESRIRIEKIYTFYNDDYYFRVEYRLTNTGRREFVFPNGYMIASPSDFLGPVMDFSNTYNILSSMYYLNGDLEKGTKGGGFFSKGGSVEKESGNVQWVGIMSRYFLLIMISDQFSGTGVIYDARKDTGYRTGMYIPADNIKPGENLIKSFKVYVGEKDKKKLAVVDQNITEAVDVSKWIEPIMDLVLWCLIKINLYVGNFGWSLVIFSFLSKIILLPLTMKSTESMKKMQALGPQINELKEKYKDNPTVLNKKTMEMYKNNKVNPLGGCLPMLLQMPFFFALYSALINSIDLWQAPFILWINDLSLPDTIFTIEGFNINILPLVMTATTFIQQKMTTVETASQQQKMMMIMPLVLLFIFWSMPSGLVLYWTLQNILQILHQFYINKKGGKTDNKS